MRGRFISFEGGEACGKTTQIEFLKTFLQAQGKQVLFVREPGGTEYGEKMRVLLKEDPCSKYICAEAKLFGFSTSRAELSHSVIKPALEQGLWVISDRFYDSTTVYQGYVGSLKVEDVERVNQIAVGVCQPDLTILLDMEVEKALERLKTRKLPFTDNFDELPVEFHTKVREGYLDLARKYPERIKSVDAANNKEAVFFAVRHTILQKFAKELAPGKTLAPAPTL